MIGGVVIVTHYRLGEEFLQALRLIVPERAAASARSSIEPKQSVEEMRGGDRRRRSTAVEQGAGRAGADRHVRRHALEHQPLVPRRAPRRGGDGREPADADQARDAARRRSRSRSSPPSSRSYGQRNISRRERDPARTRRCERGRRLRARVHGALASSGLHARPAGQFVALASRFASEIQVGAGRRVGRAGAACSRCSRSPPGAGTRLRVRAVGPGRARQAVEALGRVLEEPHRRRRPPAG